MSVLLFYILSAFAFAAVIKISAPADVSSDLSSITFNASDDVIFDFYSRRNQNYSHVITNGNLASLLSSNFMMNKPVAILVHGFTADSDDEFNRRVREAIFATMDINVISVDWSLGAREPYEEAFKNIPLTATEIVKFIKWLQSVGLKHSDLRLVGFSMGGQMVGFVARGMDQKLPYVVALDPAARMFEEDITITINAKDADYVEVIHTSVLGITQQGGHNDFYPNKGKYQTGCTNDGCNHFRSYLYLAESIAAGSSRFIGQSCESVEEALTATCNGSSHLALGGLEPKQKLGVLYLETNANPPFAQG